MSQETRNAALKEKTQQLLEGPLKHIRGAALAAALLPLASVAAAPAAGPGFDAVRVVWDSQRHCLERYESRRRSKTSGEAGIEERKSVALRRH